MNSGESMSNFSSPRGPSEHPPPPACQRALENRTDRLWLPILQGRPHTWSIVSLAVLIGIREGVPAKSPSIWIKDSCVTLQFAEVNGMWISVSLVAIATVRLLGRYTLTGLYVGARNPASN